jgi:hypothetical protein
MKKTLLLFVFTIHCWTNCLQQSIQFIDVPPLLPPAALRELRNVERERYRGAILRLGELIERHDVPAIINEYNQDTFFRNVIAEALSSESQILDQLTPLELIELARLSEAHQDLINAYRNNATTLDLSGIHLTPAVIREMGGFYPNIRRLVLRDQPSLFSRIGESEADALIRSFPHLEHITAYDIDINKSSRGLIALKLWARAKAGRKFDYTLRGVRLDRLKFSRA